MNSLLAALVASSLVLTALFWEGSRLEPTDQPRLTEAPVQETAALPDLLRPQTTLLHLGAERHLGNGGSIAQTGRIWEAARSALSLLVVNESMPLRRAEQNAWASAFSEGTSIDLQFATAQSLAWWAGHWSADGLSRLEYPRVDRVVFHLSDPGAIFFHGPDGIFQLAGGVGFYARTQLMAALEATDLKALQAYRLLPGAVAGLDLLPGVAVPLRPENSMSLGATTPALSLEQLIQGLFADPAVVRQVDLPAGWLYTDGQQALNVDRQGNLAYYNTRPEGVPGAGGRVDTQQALKLVQNFVARHVGWPEGLLLTRSLSTSDSVILQFGYGAGPWPVSSEPLLRVDVTGDRVSYMERRSLVPAPQVTPVGPLVAPEAALQTIVTAYKGQTWLRVRRIDLAYAPSGGPDGLRPIWAVELEGVGLHRVDARTGQLLR